MSSFLTSSLLLFHASCSSCGHQKSQIRRCQDHFRWDFLDLMAGLIRIGSNAPCACRSCANTLIGSSVCSANFDSISPVLSGVEELMLFRMAPADRTTRSTEHSGANFFNRSAT
ncbi:hypothetical protein BGW80DRAFT_521062 [Lactifluus volemus]|nr:hypothetical protein BGW80DRAFT_521062 [Lactifluus volemus]